MVFKTLFIIFVLLNSNLTAWERPNDVPADVWLEVEPFLIPEEHPLLPKITSIFSQAARPTETPNSLKEAGFKTCGTGHTQNFHVVKHKKVKGWLFKIYTDDAIGEKEWLHFVLRCRGKIAADKAIKTHKVEKLFKTPKKFIIPLPQRPLSNLPAHKKNFVLMVEDMKIVDKQFSRDLWKSKRVNADFLEKFWLVVSTGGLVDSFCIENCPWCEDRKVAFVDLEHYNIWPPYYPKMLPNLSPEMQVLWRKLSQTR